MFNYETYLADIGLAYLKSSTPNLENLAKIQWSHLTNYPFQSLSTVLHLPISIKPDDIYQKIVVDKQGGYCYEQNLLVLAVLTNLGYKARPLTGYIVHDNAPDTPKARTHVLLLVTIKTQDYLLDVGYGGLVPTAPLKFVVDEVQNTPHGRYKIISHDDKYIVCADVKDEWQMLYAFDLQPQNQHDLEMGNWYISTYPKSPFRNMLMVSRIEANGIRHNLLNNTYKRHTIGGPSVTEYLANTDEIITKLNDTFLLNTDEILAKGDTTLLNTVLDSAKLNR